MSRRLLPATLLAVASTMTPSFATSLVTSSGFALCLLPASLGSQPPPKTTPPKQDTRKKNGNGNGHGQTRQAQQILEWTRQLKTVGPEAREQREIAIVNLMGTASPNAHEPLRQALLRALDKPDADELEVAKVILDALRLGLKNTTHPVFGARAGEQSMRLFYLPLVVRFFMPADGGKATRHPLQDAARACLLAHTTKELEQGAGNLLKSNDKKLQRATLLALGYSRDLGMAPLLADYLGNLELGRDAAEALKRLTFVSFRNRADFDRWYAGNKQKYYKELAEQKAWHVEQLLNEKQGQLTEELRQLNARMVGILVTGQKPDRWQQIQATVFGGKQPGIQRVCLEELRARMSTGLVEIKSGSPTAKARLALWEALKKELLKEAATPERRGLLLEVTSYLVAPAETKQRVEQVKLLAAALTDPERETRLAGLRGIRQFPSVSNRMAVVAAATAGHKAKDSKLVGEALKTLQSPDWVAPSAEDKDRVSWLQALSGLLNDSNPDTMLKEASRLQVVKTLAKEDKDGGHPAGVLEVLSDLIGNTRPGPFDALRRTALVELQSVHADEESADKYVTFVLYLVEDKDHRVRLQVWTQLKKLPDYPSKREKWEKLLLANLGSDPGAGSPGLLEIEQDLEVYKPMVQRLVELAPGHADRVGRILWDAIKALNKAENKDEKLKERLTVLKRGLSGYCIAKGREPMQQIRSLELLVDIGDRDTATAILREKSPSPPKDKPEIQQRYHKLRLDLALLRSDLKPWSDKDHAQEAEAVLAAVNHMTASNQADWDREPAVRLLVLRVLSDRGAHAQVQTRAEAWLKDKVLVAKSEAEAQLLVAKSLAALKNHKTALFRLDQMKDLPKKRLQLMEQIVEVMVLDARTKGVLDPVALARTQELLEKTDKKDEAYAPRKLLELEARAIGVKDATRKTALKKELDDLFGADPGKWPQKLTGRIGALSKILGGKA